MKPISRETLSSRFRDRYNNYKQHKMNPKKYQLLKAIFTSCLIFTTLITSIDVVPALAEDFQPNYYRTQHFHSPDGLGKFYMGREIAHVMGHQAMNWLERDSRESSEKPQLVIEHLDLKPTDNVADIGSGSGYFALRIANLVPEGKVYAVDIQPEMLDVVSNIKKTQKITNIQTILSRESNPNLPESSIDLALMVDAYHEFAYPREMMANLYDALKPGGRVILVEYRKENPMITIKPLHKMSQKQVRKEMKAVNLKWLKTQEFLPQQHFMLFQKPEQ
ncbi:MAG: class I SAM-dependent methyltransferase [Xenococcaceae cyanobacterium MO_188.B19]|nr:class I SAM-dependent methyltransferase [Xenococcaceae cyanobacterium MO_188.B19]